MSDSKRTILCVDDDAELLEALRLILESGGYTVETAPSAAEGVKEYQRVQPALVFVDLMMETVDAGLDFVRQARALGAKVPIYLLSSVGNDMRSNTDAGTLGITAILEKPLDPQRLLALVRAKLGA
jgi:CheY-like chemotaxis protein